MNKFIVGVNAIFLSFASTFVFAAQNITPIYQVGDVKGTYIQVPLTHEIYAYSTSRTLQDLVVVDAEKNVLPYRLVTVAPEVQAPEVKTISYSLTFFPVAIDATPETLRKLHTNQTRVQGDKVQITTSDAVLDNKTPEFYLIDISKLDHDIDGLTVDWDAQANNQYLEIELEATRNLQDWFSIGHATLVQINQQEQTLIHNRIAADIHKKTYEFLRLKILRGADKLNITGISAEQKIGSSIVTKRPVEAWSVQGKLAANQTSVYFPSSHSKTYPVTAWEFIRNESTPIATLGIDLGNNIYGDVAKIFSRSTDNQNWQLKYQGIWFNALVGDQWQKSDAISVYENGDKFWRLELNESAKNNSSPTLVLAWEPTQLQIITNNKPPFVLAIGGENNANDTREQVFKQIVSTQSPEWTRATLVKLDIKPESLADAAKPIDWKKLTFWFALILAVVVLLLFSLRLFKQLKVSETPQ